MQIPPLNKNFQHVYYLYTRYDLYTHFRIFIHQQIYFKNSDYNVWRIVTITIKRCKSKRTL